MPAMASMTVKKVDGTTNVTWDAIQASSGQSPVVWRNALGTAWAFCPELRVSSRDGARGASRIVRATAVWPETALNTTTGIYQVVNRARFTAEHEIPKGFAGAQRSEYAAQLGNLLAHSLFVGMVFDGQAAT